MLLSWRILGKLMKQELTMTRRRAHPPDHLRIALAHALGYDEYPNDLSAEPYLRYIANRHVGRGTLDEYLKLFILVIKHFSADQEKLATVTPRPVSIRVLLDTLTSSNGEAIFADTKAGSTTRREDVEDTVMYIMGTWAMLLSSFLQLPNGFRKVTTAYNIQTQVDGAKNEAYDESLAGLLQGSRLLPGPRSQSLPSDAGFEDDVVRTAMKLVALLSQSNGSHVNKLIRSPSSPSFLANSTLGMTTSRISQHSLDAMDSLESLSIKAARLNAFTLNVLGAVQISWTHNISRHMLLSRHGGRHILEIFALPCALNATSLTSSAVGISSELAQEIQESYCILFNAWPESPLHAKLWRWLGIRRFCWCWSCSAHRYRTRVIYTYRKSSSTKSRAMKRTRKSDQHSEYDALLVELMNGAGASDWTQDLFPCLWSRIVELEEHLQAAKPWSIWILFRDRRDTLQFWTFW
ncbi:hypothetical protein N0V90_010689 [Kalmusia sp. IMI 367209]|nr:hypothetical protein N0V90_010689 [Kalmusia sp. IMI 367209]